MNELIHIDADGRITARELYEFLELRPADFSRWCRTNIAGNDFAEEGTDYEVFRVDAENSQGGRPGIDYRLTIAFAKKLCMLSRSERGEQAREYFLEVERRYQQAQALPAMTQAQLIAAIANQQAEQEQKMLQLAARTETVERSLTLVRDTILQRDDDWRDKVNHMINRIAQATTGDYRATRNESYDILAERAACDLNARLRNLRQRLQDRGATKSRLDALSRMDVIESDRRLKEIYGAVVREMMIKYVAPAG